MLQGEVKTVCIKRSQQQESELTKDDPEDDDVPDDGVDDHDAEDDRPPDVRTHRHSGSKRVNFSHS